MVSNATFKQTLTLDVFENITLMFFDAMKLVIITFNSFIG